MYPAKNPIRQPHVTLFPMKVRRTIKLFVGCLVIAAVPLGLYVRVDSKDSQAAVTVQAAGRGKQYFNFVDGRQLQVGYLGAQNLTEALQAGQAQPRSLASIVLADNAVPDLIAGYAYNGMGIVTVQHGNPEAFAPKDESVYVRMQQGYNPDSLLPVADTYLVPESPDFLQVGDFNHDNRKDVLIAGRAGNLFLLAGDGHGGLNAAEQISLPGRVTALTAGEFRALDGWTDVAIGVETPNGPALLIYDGATGFDSEPMSFQLNSPAAAVQIAGLDNDSFMDVAVAAGSEVNIIHGWGRKAEVNLQSRVERISLNNNARDLAVGFFIWNRAGSNQIAVLSDGGTVNVLDQTESDTRPFTAEETARFRTARLRVNKQPVDIESLSGWESNKSAQWSSAREFSTNSSLAADPFSQNVMQRSHVSFRETDDLLMLNASQSKLDIVRQVDSQAPTQTQSLSSGDLSTTSLDVTAAPVAVLALPQKLNGERNLVLMQSGSATPTIVPLAPTATPVVDRFDDPVGGSLAGASVCDGNPNNCSLRGAVQVANANPGSTITIPAGTVILTSNGAGAGGCDGNTIGDLGINTSTTINGAGSASTIILQNGSSPATNNDRVMCLNEPFALNIVYSFSAMTISGGRDNTSFGAAAIVAGEKGNALTLTNVVISNNQSTAATVGGGAIQILGGDLTITNSTIGGTAAPGAFGARSNSAADLAKGNSHNLSSGGGVGFDPSAPTHDASTGVFTTTGTTFGRNNAGNNGGGLTMFTASFNGHTAGTGNFNFGTSTFNNNTATGAGGAVENESFNGTVATSSFNTNSAGQRGGGLHTGGGTGVLLDGTSPSLTFANTNTAPNGSSVSCGGIMTVSGANTTIGGTSEITTNGTWTNNAGVTLNPTNFSVLGGTFTANNSTMNISGNLTIAPETTKGAIFNANTGTVNIQGNLSVNLNNGGSGAVGQFNAGTGTFNFNGTLAQSITNVSAFNFFNLTDSNVTQPLTANNSFGVGGTLNVNGANAIFAPVAAAVISGAGTLTGTGTARVTRTGADAFFGQYTITTKTLTNLTVEYIGAAAQTASVTTYGNLKINNGSGVNLGVGTTTVNGTLTLTAGALGVGTNTLVINNGTSVAAGSLTSLATGTVNYNQGSAGQSVIAANYGNLTFSAFTKVLASSGTIGIAGTFNPNGITSGHTITGSTIDFNGVVAQTVPAFNFNNLTISGSRTTFSVTLVNGGTIGIAGTFAPTATFAGGNYIITNNTIDFNGTGAQTIPAFNYNNLTISGTRAVAITLGNGNVGVAGTFNPSVTNNTWTPNAANTVVFNGAALQTIPAFAFFNGLSLNNAAGANLGGNVTVGNALTLTAGALGVGTNTLTLNGAVSATAGSLTSGTTGTVNYNQQSNGQATVLAANYGNLTFSNFSKTLASTGTIGIAGIFTPGTGTGHTITGSTINFNGAGAQNIPGFTYNNLTSSGPTVARILDPVNTIKIAGVFTPGTDVYTITGSTIEYNGAAAQTLPATFTTYNNLTLNNITSVAGFAGLTVQGLLRVQAGTFTSSSNYNNVQIDLGATMVATAASTINVSGNWSNSGTFTPSTGTVVFNGNNNTQTLSGNTTFNNLTINHTGTGNVTAVGSTLAVTGLLRVQGGTFISSSTFNNVQIDSGQTLQGTNGTTMNVTGNWTNNGGTFTPSGNTVNFNGAGAQSIGGTSTTQTFDNFTVNKSGGSTLSVVASTNTLDINGNVTLTLGTFAAGTATAITVAGNWTNNGGSFTPGAGTVTFDGGGGQAIGGTTATTFNNLTNANASGLAMNNDNTVNGILALTSSDITVVATRTLTQPLAGSSTGTFDVNGRVQRTGFVSGGGALSFGNPFNTIQVTAGVAPANIVVDLTRSVPTGPQGFPTAVQRTYTITPSAGGFTGTLRLHYLDSELNGNVEGPNFIFRRFNGTGWAPVLPTSSDFVNNWLEATGVTQFSAWTFNSTFTPTASNGVVTGRIVDQSGNPVEGTVVRLAGTQNRKFITDANGVYRFEQVETNGFYSVTPSRANYSFNPATRSFSQIGQTTEATFGATVVNDGFVNPLDTPEYFVRQHYIDFLGREPDEAGFNFWSDQIIECGTDAGCVERRRINVSAAYFLSIEFQRTGGLVDGLYRASYGVRPDFAQFMPDTRTIGQGVQVNKEGWEALLAANTEAFVNTFVNRATFVGVYGNLSDSQYVDTLISHTGVTFTSAERDALVSGLGSGSMTRAQALRSIAENGRFVNAKFNEAFVMMEYFGYLRRDPDASGFQFWLNKLNQFGGNFEQAEMVKAFIVSGEYRDRFPR
jgi:Domain of unknown function (DUF4214)